jgi:AcrR family transcriptional regulator
MSKKIDPRVKRSRLMLRTALIQLIDEGNYDEITVQQIADRAGLNRATFYLHYKDKHDLLQQSIDEELDHLVEGVIEAKPNPAEFDVNDPPPEIVKLFARVQENADFFRVMLLKGDVTFPRRMREVIMSSIGQRLREIQPDESLYLVPKEVLLHYIVGAFVSVVMWWLQNDMPYTPKHIFSFLAKMTRNGPMHNLGLELP